MENQQELQLQRLNWRKLKNNPTQQRTHDVCESSKIQHKYKTEFKINKL